MARGRSRRTIGFGPVSPVRYIAYAHQGQVAHGISSRTPRRHGQLVLKSDVEAETGAAAIGLPDRCRAKAVFNSDAPKSWLRAIRPATCMCDDHGGKASVIAGDEESAKRLCAYQ